MQTMKQIPNYWENVYDVVRCIPVGRVCTYGLIADFLTLGSARMVGWALNNCHGREDVPAHRVVNRKGELSGRHHFSPPEIMQALLESEGVKVVNDCVHDFNSVVWKPDV